MLPPLRAARWGKRMKLWRVGGVLFLIGAEALLYGYSYPFFSLALAKHDLPHWLIGLNASLAGVGILVVGPFLPKAIDFLGLNRLVALLFALAAASFLAILTVNDVVMWFAARFVMGACFSALWTTTEIWLNGAVDDRHRGRIIGGSSTLYALCQFAAPVVLGATGVTGSLPLIVAIVPLAAGAVVALLMRTRVDEVSEEHDTPHLGGLRAALSLGGVVIVVAFLSGIGETAMQALLPLYGLAHGLDDAGAARLVAVFALGEAALVLVLGWMADRYGRGLTLKLAASVATITMLLMPFAVGHSLFLVPLLFAAGGAIAGIYALGVILIGQDFRGRQLAAVSTGFGMAYSAGSVLGATPVGYLIDLFGPEALPISIAVGFAGLTVFLAWPVRRASRWTESSASVELSGLPEIKFDLSFLFEPPPAGLLDATAGLREPPVSMDLPGLPDIAFDLSFLTESTTAPAAAAPPEPQWQERSLEDWFRQRASEVAQRAHERRQASAVDAFRPVRQAG